MSTYHVSILKAYASFHARVWRAIQGYDGQPFSCDELAIDLGEPRQRVQNALQSFMAKKRLVCRGLGAEVRYSVPPEDRDHA
jgi:hypothetical protein